MYMEKKIAVLAVVMQMLLCMAAFAEEHPVQEYYAQPAADPLEGFNRCVEGFNAGCSKYVLYPIGKCYTTIVPSFVRTGIGNFAENLQFPLSLVNNCLQGKFGGAWNETKRFGINTTVGILGFWDPATAWGIYAQKEDFGQTFGHYGSGPWFYLNIPLMGPSSGRDSLGMLLGVPFNIGTYIFGDYSMCARATFAGNDAMSNHRMLNEYFTTRRETYELTRAAYLCYRDAQIADFVFTPTDEKNEIEESMGYVLLKVRDAYFDWKGVHGRVQLDGAASKLPYTAWVPRKRDSRLMVLLPGIGSHRESSAINALAEMFVSRGWTVAVVSSTYSADYFLHTRDTHLPGCPSRDCVELEAALKMVKADVESRFLKKTNGASETVLLGFSLGAINTLHLAARGQEGTSSCVFDRYVAVNPPVDPLYALQQIDAWFDIPMGWPEETRKQRVDETLRKLAGMLKEKELKMDEHPPMTLDECRFIIGMNIRLSLADLLVACKREFAPEELSKYPLDYLKCHGLDVSFGDYVNNVLLKDGEDAAAMAAQERLTQLEGPLKAAGNVFVMHNRNDFLMKSEDMAWLEATFGDRANVFPRGGHLGNLFIPDVQAELIKLVEGEQK